VKWILGASKSFATGALYLTTEGGSSRVDAFIPYVGREDAFFREATLEIIIRELAYIEATNWRGLSYVASQLRQQVDNAEGF